jgi:pentatricopeptide repeat protein
MDACEKYGSLKMILEVFEQIEECKLKPNAAIMNYLLSGLTKSNQSMDKDHKIFKKFKERQQPRELI